MGWDAQHLGKLQGNRQEREKMRRLQDQLSGEDKHEEQIHIGSDSVAVEWDA